MTTKILRLPAVIERTGLPKSTVYLRISQGTFPRPIALGFRTVGWLESEVEEWIGARVALTRSGRSESGATLQ